MYRAVVFDLDGTLVQTERLKAASYAQAAHELRPEVDPADVKIAFRDVVGGSRYEVASALLTRFGLEDAASSRMAEFGVQTPWQAYVQIRLAIYDELIADPQIVRDHRWPYNVEVVEMSRRAGCRLALATMSHCEQTRAILEALEMTTTFDFVATRDDVERPKPDPEIYTLAAHHLAVPPKETLALEDSPSGVKSALAAGLSVVAVTTPLTRDHIHQSNLLPPERIVDNHSEVIPFFDRLLGAGD
ncbi:MAG: HAD family phosphatase [Anaerolineales bacterium]